MTRNLSLLPARAVPNESRFQSGNNELICESFIDFIRANMAAKRKSEVTVPAEESDQLLIRPL